MVTFQEIQATAAEKAGGLEALQSRMPEIKSEATLRATPTPEFFSWMSFRIFSTGLNQKMVMNKWPAFEKAFDGFVPAKVAFYSDEKIEKLMQDTSIIRHLGKIRATHHNALAIVALEKEYSSFGDYIADWPLTDTVGLWADLKVRFKQLGGNSGPYFLRMMGKDGFILTPDVVAALNNLGIAEGKLTSKRDQAKVQEAFNQWQTESGLPYAHLSRTLAIFTG